ncbi:MAG: M15 family metallopeptidase [Ruminococcus sp.]|nr:M15 family metallopeptidase [Ruminococcus sp.]
MKKMKDMDWEELTDTTELGYDIKGIGIDRNYIFTVKAYKNSGGKKIFSERSRNCAFPYMTQKDGITYVDGLIIVNKTYSLPRSFGVGLSSGTQTAFNEMKAGAKADGLDIWIASGFRSYDTQYNLYWNYVARDGSQWSADRYSARPGYSEHQSGFAIDVNQASRYFNGSPVALWLKDNCWKYGFIIRYPEGKEDITGYNYESWHVRYVGKEKAKRITESGLTLEEYYGLTSRYAE